MSNRNAGLEADPLFVAITRPPMKWGVTYLALLAEMVVTMEIFILSTNPLTLLLAIPLHGVCALLCARDARFFELAAFSVRLRAPALAQNGRYWCGVSYSPLVLDLPDPCGRRRRIPTAFV
jgi:type IV secretion system protein VirB3